MSEVFPDDIIVVSSIYYLYCWLCKKYVPGDPSEQNDYSIDCDCGNKLSLIQDIEDD